MNLQHADHPILLAQLEEQPETLQAHRTAVPVPQAALLQWPSSSRDEAVLP
jgi:hypothetical protein